MEQVFFRPFVLVLYRDSVCSARVFRSFFIIHVPCCANVASGGNPRNVDDA